MNFQALSAGTFLVWLLPGVEWQTVNSFWFQGLSLPFHLPDLQCRRGACLCLCLSPVLADTGSAVSQAWKASPCLCRAASFQKSSL